jgi:hypothetical protein
MNRSPVYHKDAAPYRIVSVKEGKWQLQNRVLERGTKDTDCWLSIRRPTTKAEAAHQMYTQAPSKKA